MRCWRFGYFSIVFLLACQSQGPVGSEADAGYAATISFLLEHRVHFFPGGVEKVCLSETGWSGQSIATRLSSYHLPLQVGCDREGGDSLSLIRGFPSQCSSFRVQASSQRPRLAGRVVYAGKCGVEGFA